MASALVWFCLFIYREEEEHEGDNSKEGTATGCQSEAKFYYQRGAIRSSDCPCEDHRPSKHSANFV